MFTLDDYLTSSGKYPDRAKSSEVTDKIKDNALSYITRLNAVHYELNISGSKFSSGFRTSLANAKTPHASPTSHHMRGRAGDEEDPSGELAQLYLNNLHILEKHGLYLEDPRSTKGWVHTQDVPPKSGKRVFKP